VRLAVARPSAVVAHRLEGVHPEADELVRAGRLKDAAILADEVLGFDHDALWRAYAAFRDRRLIRANSKRRSSQAVAATEP
jgi:hypothetical protein